MIPSTPFTKLGNGPMTAVMSSASPMYARAILSAMPSFIFICVFLLSPLMDIASHARVALSSAEGVICFRKIWWLLYGCDNILTASTDRYIDDFQVVNVSEEKARFWLY